MKTPSKQFTWSFHLKSTFPPIFPKFGAADLQMNLAQSSGGVGWSTEYYRILIGMRTPRLAGF